MINYIDITILALFIISAFLGYKKGILLSIVNIIRYAFGFSLCFFCSESLAPVFYDTILKQRALEYIQTKIVEGKGIDNTLKNINEAKSSIPEFLNGMINLDNITVPKGDDISTYLLNTVAEPILISLSKVLIFLLVFIGFFVSTGLIIRLVQKSSKRHDKRRKEKDKRVPVTKRANRLLGAAFGVLKSAVLVLAVVSLLSFLQQYFDEKSTFYTMLETSRVLGVLDSINPFNFITEGMK